MMTIWEMFELYDEPLRILAWGIYIFTLKTNITLSLGAQELSKCSCQSIANQRENGWWEWRYALVPFDSFINNIQHFVEENLIVSL